MKKISILGCGWLGLPLAKKLIQHSHYVKGSTTNWKKLNVLQELEIEPSRIVLTADGIYEKAFFDTDVLFLNIPPGRKDPDAETTYPAKIKSIFEYLSKDVKIIFASSTGVYPNNNDLVNEKTAPAPVRKSGKAVLAAEELLKKQFKNLCILRFAGLTGPGRNTGSFLSGKQNIPNGNSLVNLVHLDDCLNILLKIIDGNYWGQTFNVVADEHPSRKELYTFKAKEADLAPPIFNEEKGPFKLVTNAKIKTMLGYEFLHPDPMLF